MTRIIQGVLSFQKRVFADKKGQFEALAGGQKPLALFVTCSDSRVMPEMLAQTQPGELFVLRNAGNLVPPHSAGTGGEAATVEYAVAQLKVRDVIVCGHSRCGAMHGLIEPEGLAEKLPGVAAWLEYAKGILPEVSAAGEGLSEDEKLTLAIERNVLLQLEHLKTHPAVKGAMEARHLRLHGWVYHFETGKVDYYDPLRGKFVPVEQRMSEAWKEARQDATPRTEWQTRG